MTEFVCELTDARYEMDWTPKEEIVRCRDCRHYHSYQDLCERLRPGMVVMDDGFCAWAERKEGGDD